MEVKDSTPAVRSRPLYAIFGHHKCATIWLEDLSRIVCQRLGLRLAVVYDEDQFGRDLPRFIEEGKYDFLLYGNADVDFVRPVPNLRGIHVVRDPRDIVVSAYFSHLHSHSTEQWKELLPHRERLTSLDQDEGLLEEIRFRSRSFRHLSNWDYKQENVFEIRFEDISTNSYSTMLKAFDFLGLLRNDEIYTRRARAGFLVRDVINRLHARHPVLFPIHAHPETLPPPELLAIIWHLRYSRRARGRKKGTQDVRSHYRSGQAGDWVNYFKPAHKSLFKDLYPELVPKLGYSANDEW